MPCFEPNINVHITDEDGKVHKRPPSTEIKNLNSFNVLERATAYRSPPAKISHWEQTPGLEAGRSAGKSTYGWTNEASQATYWQRNKEGEADYRYFPDPDLVPVEVDDIWLTELKGQIGELPMAWWRSCATPTCWGRCSRAAQGGRGTGRRSRRGRFFRCGADGRRRAATGRFAHGGPAGDGKRAVDPEFLELGATRPASSRRNRGPMVVAGKIAAGKETAKALIAAITEADRPAEQAAARPGLDPGQRHREQSTSR